MSTIPLKKFLAMEDGEFVEEGGYEILEALLRNKGLCTFGWNPKTKQPGLVLMLCEENHLDIAECLLEMLPYRTPDTNNLHMIDIPCGRENCAFSLMVSQDLATVELLKLRFGREVMNIRFPTFATAFAFLKIVLPDDWDKEQFLKTLFPDWME